VTCAALQILPGEAPRSGTCVFALRQSSRIDRKQELLDRVAGELLGKGWVAEADRHWLYLCLDEVVVNAMLHGNAGDPLLEVEVALWAEADRWALLITDQGDGFALADLPDADDPASLLLEHGRGIRIMREWLDELAYYRGGASARLSRLYASAPPEER